jgi:hypothetical protein
MVELTGNLARRAQETLVAKMCDKNLLMKEGLNRKMEAMRTDLTGANPSPLVRLLVEQVVACWLHLAHLEANYYGRDSMPLPLAMHYERTMTLAQKRYLASIKMLAQVRKVGGLAFDVPQARGATAVPATLLPLVRRAANGPNAGELPRAVNNGPTPSPG